MMRLSRPPPLKNLRAFCAAARHRSFKFAADELCVTPSAVSHQMKELEASLAMRLFERKTRSLELTTAAHRLLDEVEPLLEALDRTLAQFARRNGRLSLRVRMPAMFANELFIPRLAQLLRGATPDRCAAGHARPAARHARTDRGCLDPAGRQCAGGHEEHAAVLLAADRGVCARARRARGAARPRGVRHARAASSTARARSPGTAGPRRSACRRPSPSRSSSSTP